MSLASTASQQINTRLPKLISPLAHGAIDYSHTVFFFGMALLCRKRNPPAALAALTTATLVLGESLLTDYPLGLKPVLPFAVHGQLDAGFAAVSFLIPKIFGFEDTKAATIFKANAFMEGTIAGLTDFSSKRAHDENAAGLGAAR